MRALICLYASLAASQDWPEFRGPSGQGHAAGSNLPLTWSESSNVKWKVPVPGRGWSSPSILGDRIWVTSAVEIPGGPMARSLRALSFDKATGKQLADAEVFRLNDAGPQHEKNTYASPTPVLEGDRVWVHYGRLGTACLRSTGEMLWKTRFDYDYVHGTGGSPVLYKDLLLLSCDGTDVQFVVALDKSTGRVRWKTNRPQPAYMAFSTPLLIEVNGKTQLVSPGGHQTVAYDPDTGRELWSVRYGDGFSNVPRPVYGHGLVFLCTGFNRASLLAVRPDGRGDVTNTHVAWRFDRSVPLTPSPIVVGDELYLVSDNGILSCLDARTGGVRWQQRLGSGYSASPLHADGRIYWLSEEGETTVITPGRSFRALATNQVDGMTYASIAVSAGAFFLRSATHLYRIEKSSR